MTKERIAILGATGSIGTSALEVIGLHPERFEGVSLTAASRVEELARLCAKWRPSRAIIAKAECEGALKARLAALGVENIEVLSGEAAIAAEAARSDVDTVLLAIVGAAGLAPSFAAARAGKRMLLANKESVVCGGRLLMDTVTQSGATLLPVDSEHSAIYQSLKSRGVPATPFEIVLTCSGGPFRNRADLSGITPEDALAHPTWAMGAKITIDSATLMNKGLEVIEARYLFDCAPKHIHVVIHPQSIIHSMVRFADGCAIAQLGLPDMKSPIAFALGYPERIASGVAPLALEKIGSLTFEAPDTNRFPLLKLAYEALSDKAAATTVLNAANEVAVDAFLRRALSFTGIFKAVALTLEHFDLPEVTTLDDILAVDREARLKAKEALTRC